MSAAVIVHAEWDDEAGVWVAHSPNLAGLHTEAESVELLREKLPNMILDLKEGQGEAISEDIPIEIIAHANTMARAS